MRIGFIAPPGVPVPPPAYGGTESVVDRLARGLALAGHDVLLAAAGNSTCPVPRVAGTEVEVVPVPGHLAPPFFPLIRTDWATQQRSAAKARAAGLPATPLEVTVAAVREWDLQRGEPPLGPGFTAEQERAILAQHDSGAYR